MQRLVYIDYIKFTAIFLVVLGHLPLVNQGLCDWIFSFHVPLFFFVSGYLCKIERDWQNPHFLRKTVKGLLLVTIPYFIIDTMYQGAMDYIFYRATFSVQHNIIDRLVYYITGDSRIGPMWFLLALFWMKVGYNYISRLIGMNYNLWLLIGSTTLSAIVFYTGFRYNNFQISTTLMSFPFYCLGVSAKQYDILNSFSKRKYAYFLISGICLVASLILLPKFGHLNINGCQFGENFFMYLLMPILGTTFICMLYLKINKLPKFVKTISSGTLVVLCAHFWLVQPLKMLYKKMLSINSTPPYMDLFSGIIISFMVLVLLAYPIDKITNSRHSYIRFLAGK